jgi:polar amino acid transport system permease protein
MLDEIFKPIIDILPSAYFIFQGVLVTLNYSIISVFFGLILGTLIAMCKIAHNPIIRSLANFYTSIFRGTPLLIQLSIVYFGLPSIFDIKVSIFLGGVIAFSLNSAAYVSEVIRAGILSIDKGQFEAAKALNISNYYLYKDIIIPQAIRNILPALINELINLVKESAIISIIGGNDIMYRAQMVAAETYRYFMPMLIAAIYYYIMVMLLTYLAKILERKLAI